MLGNPQPTKVEKIIFVLSERKKGKRKDIKIKIELTAKF